MTNDEEIDSYINQIKSIFEEYLSRISDAIQQPKTFDQLIEGLNGLIGPSIMTRNLQRSSSFFYNFFMQPTYRSSKEVFSFSEDKLDRLRDLELQLDSKILAKFSALKVSSDSSLMRTMEQVSQDLEGLKSLTEDLEAQTHGFTDRTNRHGANYPIDFIILSAHNIRKIIRRLEIDYKHLSSLPEYGIKRDGNQPTVQIDTIELLRNLFSKFHRVVIALSNRHSKRAAFKINDEYDVQDLLYPLLLLYFDDIRTEEWTPSYAGGAARMDLLLKKEKLVIECKKTRKGLGMKEVGDQLIIDTDRYRNHADCKTLVCFIYDPEGTIRNPAGLRDDIEGKSNSGFQILIYIEP